MLKISPSLIFAVLLDKPLPYPVDTRRRFNVDKMSLRCRRRCKTSYRR